MPLDEYGLLRIGLRILAVVAEPAPMIFVQSLDESGVSNAVRPWASSEDYWLLQWELPERVKQRFVALCYRGHHNHGAKCTCRAAVRP